MSLDIYFYDKPKMVKPLIEEFNITHNLVPMAKEVGLYNALWQPEEIEIKTAKDLLPYLETGKYLMIRDKGELEKLNPSNGWGSYDGFLDRINDLIKVCSEHPEATIEVSK